MFTQLKYKQTALFSRDRHARTTTYPTTTYPIRKRTTAYTSNHFSTVRVYNVNRNKQITSNVNRIIHIIAIVSNKQRLIKFLKQDKFILFL